MVRESLEPGQCVSVVARRNGINADQLFLWRKLYPEGSLSTVSAHRIGTTLQFLVSLMAAAERLPVAAFWICSLHQAIIGLRRSM